MLVGGYLVTIVGIAGVVGNCLAIGILVKLKVKSNINLILTGKLQIQAFIFLKVMSENEG